MRAKMGGGCWGAAGSWSRAGTEAAHPRTEKGRSQVRPGSRQGAATKQRKPPQPTGARGRAQRHRRPSEPTLARTPRPRPSWWEPLPDQCAFSGGRREAPIQPHWAPFSPVGTGPDIQEGGW